MKTGEYDNQASEVAQRLPRGPRLAVIGSASCWGDDSREICQYVGTRLAELENLVLLTGGVPGVGESVGRSFFEARRHSSLPPNVYHALPTGSKPWDYGVTLFAGASMAERREILGRLAPLYHAIEGGPGTEHEATVARTRGAILIPIGRTGGYSQDIYPHLECTKADVEMEWRMLGDSHASTKEVGAAVQYIVDVLAVEDV